MIKMKIHNKKNNLKAKSIRHKLKKLLSMHKNQ